MRIKQNEAKHDLVACPGPSGGEHAFDTERRGAESGQKQNIPHLEVLVESLERAVSWLSPFRTARRSGESAALERRREL